MHRLRAAILRGEQAVQVHYLDCDEAEAFVLGVRANVTHGLPLSLADRRVAAMRIITSYPHWSDRAIAAAAGLSAKTVGAIRWCATDDEPRSHSRVGRDGRVRPLSSAEGRRQASAMIKARPGDSLRQIASASGISPGTVRDVRARLARGEDPVPPRQRQRDESPAPAPARTDGELAELLSRLKHDPSLRCTEMGRALIRLLGVNALTEKDRRGLLDAVPEHCRGTVAELAHACAKAWQDLADCFDDADCVDRRAG
jgi:transposase